MNIDFIRVERDEGSFVLRESTATVTLMIGGYYLAFIVCYRLCKLIWSCVFVFLFCIRLLTHHSVKVSHE